MTKFITTCHSDLFWRRVELGQQDECWPWTGACTKGYGQTWDGTRQLGAHQRAFQLAVGPIPDGLDILHTCDNRPCCNPRHLYAGTDADNTRDKMQRGVWGRGETNGRAKLTWSDVEAIRADRISTNRYLGEVHGVKEATISKVRRRVTWN